MNIVSNSGDPRCLTSEAEIRWLFRSLFDAVPTSQTVNTFANIRAQLDGSRLDAQGLSEAARVNIWMTLYLDVDALHEALKVAKPHHLLCRMIGIACYLAEVNSATRAHFYQRSQNRLWVLTVFRLAGHHLVSRLKATMYRVMGYV